MERVRAQEREQLRLLQELNEGVNAQARETQRTMDRIRLMLQDQTTAQDREMQRDTERLRTHLNAVTEGLQEMATVMEQMHKRVQQRIGTN